MIGRTYKIETIKDWDKVEQVLLLFDMSFSRPLSERVGNLRDYAQKLAENAIIHTISIEDKTIGFIAYYCNDVLTKEAYITQIAVVDHYKRLRIGNILLDLCVEMSKQKGMKKLVCEVDDENFTALKFYKKYEFSNLRKASNCSHYLVKII